MKKSILVGKDWLYVHVKISTAKSKDRPAKFCVRTDLLPVSPIIRKENPVSAGFEWTYDSKERALAPNRADMAVIEQFERVLNDRLLSVKNPPLVLTSILQGAGVRTWKGYTPSEKIFVEAVDDALKDFSQYPIRLVVNDDPDWGEYVMASGTAEASYPVKSHRERKRTGKKKVGKKKD